MPRQRTARLPLLGSADRRSEGTPTRSSRALRARLAAVLLVVLSLALVTVYLRESPGGALHGMQRVALGAVAPLEVAGERVSRPFRDAWGWTSELFHAKAENERLQEEVEVLRQQVIVNQTAAQENERLRDQLAFVTGPRFPEDYDYVTTRVISQPPTPFDQTVVIAAGTEHGISRNDPVVTTDGSAAALVGLVTDVGSNAARVTLITDQQSNVSAVVLESGAQGIVRQGASGGPSLVLDRVAKDEVVEKGNLVVTAGWQTPRLESLYPYGIPVGTVAAASQQDVDLYKRIQVSPLVDFDSLADVIVLVRAGEEGGS